MLDLNKFEFNNRIMEISHNSEIAREAQADLAHEISWESCSTTTSTMRTHYIQKKNGRLEFKQSMGMKLFSRLFIIVGLGIFYFGVVQDLREYGFDFDYVDPMLLFGSLLFVAAGVFFMFTMSKEIVFDKARGFYWNGKFDSTNIDPEDENQVKLSDIQALQVIEKHVKSSQRGQGSHYAYELNLVRISRKRAKVVCYGSAKDILQDGLQLAEFLDVPIWTSKKV
jgi:hypothetical protein